MARPGRKKRTALFIVEIICLLLFIGGLYVYGQIDSRLNKIETPQLDESKIVTNVTAPQTEKRFSFSTGKCFLL